MDHLQAELIFDAKALLGEGPFWSPLEKSLYWLDIEGRMLHQFFPDTGNDVAIPLSRRVGCVVPTNRGTLLLAGENGISEYFPQTKETCFLGNPEEKIPTNRLNDGKCSPEGRFWFGSLSMIRKPNDASFYVMHHDRKIERKLTSLTTSNGLGWSPDGETFYHIDTPTRMVTAFDYNSALGEISNRRTVIRFPEDAADNWIGRPDGMTIDAEGNVWVAHWTGGRVSCWNPQSGELLCTVHLPVSRVSSVTFGGDDLKTLFITTASFGLSEEEQKQEPLAGGIFSVMPGVSGLPVNQCRAGKAKTMPL